MERIAYMYAQGLYVDRDIDKAREYYDKAVNLGKEDARCAIFGMYLEIEGFEKAFEYLNENQDEPEIDNLITKIQAGATEIENTEQNRDACKKAFMVIKNGTTTSTMPLASKELTKYTRTGEDTDRVSETATRTTYYYEYEVWVLSDPAELGFGWR